MKFSLFFLWLLAFWFNEINTSGVEQRNECEMDSNSHGFMLSALPLLLLPSAPPPIPCVSHARDDSWRDRLATSRNWFFFFSSREVRRLNERGREKRVRWRESEREVARTEIPRKVISCDNDWIRRNFTLKGVCVSARVNAHIANIHSPLKWVYINSVNMSRCECVASIFSCGFSFILPLSFAFFVVSFRIRIVSFRSSSTMPLLTKLDIGFESWVLIFTFFFSQHVVFSP